MSLTLTDRKVKAKLLRLRDVVQITGLSQASIYRAMARGDFPRQFAVGSGSVRWDAREVHSWIRRKKEEAEAARAAPAPDAAPTS
jgi:prophage regulatory protein